MMPWTTIVEEFIVAFEQFTIYTKGMYVSIFKECYIIGLKNEVQPYVLMDHSTT